MARSVKSRRDRAVPAPVRGRATRPDRPATARAPAMRAARATRARLAAATRPRPGRAEPARRHPACSTSAGRRSSTARSGSRTSSGPRRYKRCSTFRRAGWKRRFETPATGLTDFTNSEMVLGFDARNWSDFQSASETLAAQVTATDTALAKVYSGTDPAGFISTVGRRAYRRPLTAAEQATYLTLLQQGLVADRIAQHVRQGRVAGHPRDAAVAVFPLPDRARGEGRGAEQLRDGGEAVPVAAGNGPGRQDAGSGGGHRQARHRGRCRGARHHDAGRGGGHDGHAPVPWRMAASRRSRHDLARSTSRPTRPR